MWVLDGESHLTKCSGRDRLLSDLHLMCKLTLHLAPSPPPPARAPQNYVGDKVGKTAANPPHEVSCSVKGSKWFCFAKLRFLKRNGSQRATQRGNSLTCIHGVLTTEGSTERALAGVDRPLSPQDLEKYLFKMS